MIIDALFYDPIITAFLKLFWAVNQFFKKRIKIILSKPIAGPVIILLKKCAFYKNFTPEPPVKLSRQETKGFVNQLLKPYETAKETTEKLLR